jgi:RNase P/RNase MRP subunit POP5
LLRSRRRYLLVEVTGTQGEVSAEAFENAVSRVLARLGGWLALAEAEIRVLKPRAGPGRFILRCSHKRLPTVLLALTLLREIDGQRVSALVVRASGTVKGVRG